MLKLANDSFRMNEFTMYTINAGKLLLLLLLLYRGRDTFRTNGTWFLCKESQRLRASPLDSRRLAPSRRGLSTYIRCISNRQTRERHIPTSLWQPFFFGRHCCMRAPERIWWRSETMPFYVVFLLSLYSRILKQW